MAAPLIEATRKQFEQQLAQKDSEIAQREAGQARQGKATGRSQANKLDEQVADQVAAQLKAERARIIAAKEAKANLGSPADLENKARELADLQEVLNQRNEKLAEAQKSQAELIKKQRELDDARRELELTIQKRTSREGPCRNPARSQKKEAEDELKLKVKEKGSTIASMQQTKNRGP